MLDPVSLEELELEEIELLPDRSLMGGNGCRNHCGGSNNCSALICVGCLVCL
jgi:hypothetical protein